MVHHLPPADPGEHLVFLGATLPGNDEGDVPTHGLRTRPAEHPLGGRVPGRDDAIQGLADDRVVRALDDGGQPSLGDLPAHALRFDHLRVLLRADYEAQPIAMAVQSLGGKGTRVRAADPEQGRAVRLSAERSQRIRA